MAQKRMVFLRFDPDRIDWLIAIAEAVGGRMTLKQDKTALLDGPDEGGRHRPL